MPVYRHLAEKHLQNEDRLSRKSFKPAVIVCDTLADDPGSNRKTLSLADIMWERVMNGIESELHSVGG